MNERKIIAAFSQLNWKKKIFKKNSNIQLKNQALWHLNVLLHLSSCISPGSFVDGTLIGIFERLIIMNIRIPLQGTQSILSEWLMHSMGIGLVLFIVIIQVNSIEFFIAAMLV